jgi:mannosyl-3-phosphoglycerate phosphatase
MTTTPKLVIFTDLDGTLLDRNSNSFDQAKPALRQIKEKGIPLVLSSGKTRGEIELYRNQLENDHPFISENGGAVFVPKHYFSFPCPYNRELDEYFVLELGTFYLQIVEVLESIKKETGISIKRFSDLSEEELASLSGLSLEEVALAKKRECDEPFIIEGGEREVDTVKKKIEVKGMNYAWGGKFHHILGKNDKGRAVEILKELYENEFFSISTVGIADSLNDLPMLSAADHPIFLRQKDDILPEALSSIQNLVIVDGTRPGAWNDVILSIVNRF